jgi:hypothetical protein
VLSACEIVDGGRNHRGHALSPVFCLPGVVRKRHTVPEIIEVEVVGQVGRNGLFRNGREAEDFEVPQKRHHAFVENDRAVLAVNVAFCLSQ